MRSQRVASRTNGKTALFYFARFTREYFAFKYVGSYNKIGIQTYIQFSIRLTL